MLPALTENRVLRLSTITAMYFAQGVQSGLLFTAIPAYFAMRGVEPVVIGSFISLLFLPWSFKIISAPIMDRFSFLPMGRRRPWVIAGMIGALIGYIIMSLVPEPLENIPMLIAAGMVVSVSTAFMDVAIDGMTVDIISSDEYSTANAFMTGGNIIGFAATTAIAGVLLSKFGIPTTMLLTAVLIGLLTLFPILLRERIGERLLPFTKGEASKESLELQMKSWSEIGEKLFAAIFVRNSILLASAIFLFGIAYGLFQTYMPVLAVQELGWTDTAFSGLIGTAGLVAGVAAMVIANPIIRRLEIKRSFTFFIMVFALLGIVMGFIPFLWETPRTIQTFVFAYYGLRTFLLIILFTFAMLICQKTVAATQFALYTSVANLGISIGAAIYAPMESVLTYPQIFFAFAVLLVLMLPIVKSIRTSKNTSIASKV